MSGNSRGSVLVKLALASCNVEELSSNPHSSCKNKADTESSVYEQVYVDDAPTVQKSNFLVTTTHLPDEDLEQLGNIEGSNGKIILELGKLPSNSSSDELFLSQHCAEEVLSISDLNDNNNNSQNESCHDSTYAASYNPANPTTVRLTRLTSNERIMSSDESSDTDDSDADPNFSDAIPSESESNGSTSSERSPTGKKGKRKMRQPENWCTKKAKLHRNSGKSYVSSSKTKKHFSSRKMGPPCGEKCRLGCSNKIDNKSRSEIFSGYWNLACLQRQREFIVSHAEPIKPKYRYSSTQNLRSLNMAYYFSVNQQRIRVCKTFFMSTLDINDRPIRTALAKKTETGFVESDKRGKHGNQPKVATEIKESVKKFINAIPRVESHYLRAQTSREYIEGGKSLADLYRDYKEDQVRQQLPFANSVMFNRIFNSEFNISFFMPRKDLCDLCESFKNANEEDKQQLMDRFTTHQREKELSRKEKEMDKNNNSNGVHVAVYDLQAVMPAPRGLVSSFYYKSKLNCFNFTISDLRATNVQCYFWNETEGKRGAVEIGSSVLRYLKSLVETSGNKDLEVIFYSDNCCGQQKNKFLLAAYAYAVQNFGFHSITHKYLIHGHSQNEGDNVHSVIEKQIAKHLKCSPIYVPAQYVTLIQLAKKRGPPYHVNELTFEHFYDVKLLQERWGTNFNVDTTRMKVKWQEIKVLRVERNHPQAFYYKTSYSDANFKTVNVCNKKSTRSSEDLSSVELVRAYSGKIPLPDNKKRDIQELVDKNIIPKFYFNSFFKNILE